MTAVVRAESLTKRFGEVLDNRVASTRGVGVAELVVLTTLGLNQ